MEKLGQKGVTQSGIEMIEEVLWQPGTLQSDTIFTSTQTAFAAQKLNVYHPPSEVST